MVDYHWPCHVFQDEAGNYRVSPAGIGGDCDGTGKTREEAEARALEALQHFLSSEDNALLAIGLCQHTDLQSVMAGETIRLKVDLPG